MGLSHYTRLLVVFFLLWGGIAPAQTLYPLNHNPFTLDYDRLYRDAITKQDLSLLPPVGPFSTRTLIDNNDSPALACFSPSDESHIRLFTLATETYESRKNIHGDDFPSIIGGFSHRLSDHIAAIGFFNLDRRLAVDPDYTGKKYRGLAGEVETAAIRFEKGRFTAAFGRMRNFWGPQRINLILSETADPFDQLTASYTYGRLTFNFLFARLDAPRPDSVDIARDPAKSYNENRYLALHRLDLRLHRRFRLGLFESVIFGGVGRPPELYYLNPLQFFHSAQLNEDINDNTILGFDFVFLPGWHTTIYGQGIIDDVQIDNKEQSDQEPNEIGLMAGLFRAGRTGSIIPDLKIEYVRITNRTYHQREPRNRYLYRNNLIGHPLGPDADSLSLLLRFWPREDFNAGIELAYTRHGAGSIHEPWDEPWLEINGNYSEPFPTGTVEKSFAVAVRANGYLPLTSYTRRHIIVSLEAGWSDIANAGNIANNDKTDARLHIGLSWLGFTDISLD